VFFLEKKSGKSANAPYASAHFLFFLRAVFVMVFAAPQASTAKTHAKPTHPNRSYHSVSIIVDGKGKRIDFFIASKPPTRNPYFFLIGGVDAIKKSILIPLLLSFF
jgi:hypothetical protein